MIIAASRQDEPLPAGVESRVGEFTELVATAISNVQAWSDLAASRGRIVAAADEERRRVVRDLHDGAQQRLVHTVVVLKLARQVLEKGADDAPAFVTEAINQAEQANTELGELAHGILPRVLMHGGLRAGVDALAARMPVPVDIDVSVRRLPAPIEATAYFVVAEALTNVAKHARARTAAVGVCIEGDTLRVEVRDDGLGGARPGGSGLVGLRDRLAVLEGRLRESGGRRHARRCGHPPPRVAGNGDPPPHFGERANVDGRFALTTAYRGIGGRACRPRGRPAESRPWPA